MTNPKLIAIVLLIGLYSCGERQTENRNHMAAIELNNDAMRMVRFLDNRDSAQKGISLLDRATSLDSNYFLGYYNKLIFYNQLREYDNAIITVNKLIRLKPNAHDLYLTGGLLREKTGDSTGAKAFFEKSLTLSNQVLETMNPGNPDYEMVIGNKAMNLIMLNERSTAVQLLKDMYESQTGDEAKGNILKLMNSSKRELIEQF
ncbi:MAG: hypothetical protein JSR97_05330 [Verrucomicrobia bacterium]|nr:hypothetical protein [Verrucomicrobiota bacterium]